MTSPSNPYTHSKRNGSTSSTAPFNPPSSHGPGPPSAFSPPPNTGYRASGSSQGTRSSTSTAINPLTSSHMESTVTRLLVATKQLLESLTDWSQGRIDEGGVSDIYVRLGNEFNAASLAFSKEGIDMNDLNSVPEDLRGCLEAALSEEASPTTLDQHLPQIRQIVVHLLQGLKVKQAKWRAAKRQQEIELAHSSVGSLSNRTSGRDMGPPERPTGPHPSSVRAVPVTRTLNATRSREELRRAANANEFHRTSSNARAGSPGPYPTSRMPSGDSSHLSKSYDGYRKPSVDQSGSENAAGSSAKTRASPVNRAVRSVNELTDRFRGTRASPPPPPPTPPHPNSNSASYGIPIPPIPASPRSDHSAQVSSLEALRKTDTLQRRASKRFSTYTYNKIAATASPHKRSGEGQGSLGIGLGINVPALPLSPSKLALLLPQEDDGSREATEAGRELVRGKSSVDQGRLVEGDPFGTLTSSFSKTPGSMSEGPDSVPVKQMVSPILEESDSSIHILSTPGRSPAARTPHPVTTTPVTGKINMPQTGLGQAPGPPSAPTIFLQLGRDVKKAKLETPPTIASLRVLFMDRFQYSPGLEDFPAIYIRDPQSGVQYQLEDMSEVKDRVVLSLNIDVLDQVKTHIDTGLSGLARELKDLKSSINTLRRQSVSAAASASLMTDSLSAGPSPALRPTENQFKNAARMLQRVNTSQPVSFSALAPTPTDLASTTTATAIGSPVPPSSASSFTELKLQQISGTFKNQFNEVQALRRELGILRQLYGTFTGETKDLIAGLRSQAEQVKQVASTKVSAPRTSINLVKSKLESRSQDLVTKIESLQDTVEDLKQDVTTRKMRPKPSTMISVSESIATVGTDLEDLASQIAALKPSWKKSWEEELQNIVDEQQLLNYQEDLVKDLKEDLSAVSSLFGHVKDYLDVRKTAKLKPREFISSIGLMSASGNPKDGLDTVLMQVKALEPKSEPRLKAIEAAERAREKSIREAKDDEFAQELAGFVGGKKLKMTGGTEETERLRKIKSEQTLKAMMGSMNEVAARAGVPVPVQDTGTESEDKVEADPEAVEKPAEVVIEELTASGEVEEEKV
ncbi:hypothetical protein CROQUDRAFT_653995 [Cronartium quercuum f. sp. fusiforme G11]|uniref:Actin interacting protein 3 C-terminal domain-containing protein n=1 Tax=Cronartium quercuum f. sp. fusiforme G11 TaxID=708437 RepID=A0A9P6NNK0_9BASI|nr:hypothetical protein CROQUDRAFT_653995 [Cronartium quercuum f. sp. fusiforme G11]